MLKIMLVFEKYATLLVEERLQLGDKMIHDYAFCSNSLLSARFTGNYEHLGSFHVFSAIRELNFVEVQNTKIMFFFFMENLLDLRSTDKLFLEMSFNPLPRPPPLWKKWLLPLNEIYKGKEITVYMSIPYITYPKVSTYTAHFQGFTKSNCKIIK